MRGVLPENMKIIGAAAAAAAGTSAVTGSGIDLSQNGGWEGVLFVTRFGTPAANNVLHVEQSDDNGSSDAYDDLEGSEVNAGASDDIQWVYVHRPAKDWLRAVVLRGTSSTCDGIFAYLVGNRDAPYDNNEAGVIAGHILHTPPEGSK